MNNVSSVLLDHYFFLNNYWPNIESIWSIFPDKSTNTTFMWQILILVHILEIKILTAHICRWHIYEHGVLNGMAQPPKFSYSNVGVEVGNIAITNFSISWMNKHCGRHCDMCTWHFTRKQTNNAREGLLLCIVSLSCSLSLLGALSVLTDWHLYLFILYMVPFQCTDQHDCFLM